MNRDSARELIAELLAESISLPADHESRVFISWVNRTSSSLHALIGDDHKFTLSFDALNWYRVYEDKGSLACILTFQKACAEAQGILEAAIFTIDALPKAIAAVNDEGIDQELWSFVSADVLAESWGKAITQSCLFLEDSIRKWASRPTEDIGETLMTNVFGERGTFRLGMTEGERQGWHRFAMGIAMALRNPSGHRISERDDHRTYALGVIGACSLLLTQLKYEHSNSFTR